MCELGQRAPLWPQPSTLAEAHHLCFAHSLAPLLLTSLLRCWAREQLRSFGDERAVEFQLHAQVLCEGEPAQLTEAAHNVPQAIIIHLSIQTERALSKRTVQERVGVLSTCVVHPLTCWHWLSVSASSCGQQRTSASKVRFVIVQQPLISKARKCPQLPRTGSFKPTPCFSVAAEAFFAPLAWAVVVVAAGASVAAAVFSSANAANISSPPTLATCVMASSRSDGMEHRAAQSCPHHNPPVLRLSLPPNAALSALRPPSAVDNRTGPPAEPPPVSNTRSAGSCRNACRSHPDKPAAHGS